MKLQKYFDVLGMVEKYQNLEYKPLNTSVNKDINDWKQYKNNMKISEQDQIELQFDLTDAVVQGSGESLTQNGTDQVMTTFQLRSNPTTMESDTYLSCMSNSFENQCFEILLDEDEAIQKMRNWESGDSL